MIARSSSFMSSWKYDVFLSFREEDTGKSFTDHLYKALDQKGINPFRDDNKLGSYQPFKEIEESRFAIVVFSKNYASSTRLLDQLVKIVECKDRLGLTVFPVFYHVDPAHFRRQTDECGKAFDDCEQAFPDKVKNWKMVLTQVVNLAGWDLRDRSESCFIEGIVRDILKQLKKGVVFDKKELLVGMGSRMDKMDSLLDIGRWDDVRMVGICGERGIGKTTLAGEVFTRMYGNFEACAFIENVRQECQKYGMIHLQKLLYRTLLGIEDYKWNGDMEINLSRTRLQSKKVLIILDDVDELEQINETLVGNWGRGLYDCLGPGSRVVVTTTKSHLLSRYGEDNVYEVDKLTDDEALQVLCQMAFKENHGLNGYNEVCNDFVQIANGNPLTLRSLASFLFGRPVAEWMDTIAKLKENPMHMSVLIDQFM